MISCEVELRVLKGAPLAVLLALCGQGGAMTAVELQAATGYSDKPVRAALKETLETLGLAESAGHMQGWTVTPRGRGAMLAIVSGTAVETADAGGSQCGGGSGPRAAGGGDMRRFCEEAGGGEVRKNSEAAAEDGRKSAGPAGNCRKSASTAVLANGRKSVWAAEDRRKSAGADGNGQKSVWPDRKNSEGEADIFRVQGTDQDDLDLDHDLILYKHKSDHDHNQNEASRKNGRSGPEERGSGAEAGTAEKRGRKELEVLAYYLKEIGIEGDAYREILARDRLLEVVAWHWFVLVNTWIKSPLGWMIKCLGNGDRPDIECQRLARLWLTMGREDYAEYVALRFRPVDLEAYWEDWQLSLKERKIMVEVKRHGGLDIFEEFERPILGEE